MLLLINRLRFLFLFIVLLFFFLIKAISTQMGWVNNPDILFSVIIISSIFIIGNRTRLLIAFISIFILSILVFHLLGFYFDLKVVSVLRLVTVIMFLLIMTSYCFYFTLQDRTISITT